MSRLRILFLTGQSNRYSCALTPDQSRVAHLLRAAGYSVGELNFPYDPELEPYTRINLLSASLSNARQFLTSRRPAFRARYRDRFIAQVSDNVNHLILAGSCGLELINNLDLPGNVLSRVHVLAYGPVARWVPDRNVTVIQGRRDWVSRLSVKRCDHRVDCGHMDYLASQGFVDVLLDKARTLTA